MTVQSTGALLLALQYADSAFPAGGFAHSWGLETGVAVKAVRTPADLEAACRAVLRYQVARTEAVAAAGCCHAALDRVIAIDRRLSATRAARETREASLRTGRRLLDVATANEADGLLAELRAAVRDGLADGNHATVLGTIAGRGGLSPEAAAALTLWSAANALASAAMRLLPVSHADVQTILARLRPFVAELAATAAATDPLSFGGSAPLFEIWSMQHEMASVRLFAS